MPRPLLEDSHGLQKLSSGAWEGKSRGKSTPGLAGESTHCELIQQEFSTKDSTSYQLKIDTIDISLFGFLLYFFFLRCYTYCERHLDTKSDPTSANSRPPHTRESRSQVGHFLKHNHIYDLHLRVMCNTSTVPCRFKPLILWQTSTTWQHSLCMD
ncbi:hypothetical protein BDV28DRAFT_139844 [Aspergillus coremiiformis]|uniref:Uncharacterized protein n=1 Tax=Aspergillus coremiiformis TaxID=138285 RepID=A0A5N6YYQ8_9EURO|nr:hypothetical protein BDV28DRAFT_139844 [Aspergillus coremiiformis]